MSGFSRRRTMFLLAGPLLASRRVLAQHLNGAERVAFGKHVAIAEATAKRLGLVLDYDRPPKQTKRVRAAYPPEAVKKGLQGKVLVLAVIDSNGRVSHAEVLESAPPFDEPALESVKAGEFAPALKAGRAVSTIGAITVSFSIH